MDLAQATQAMHTVTLAGRDFSVRQLRLREWGVLQAWLKEHYPSPITLAVEAVGALRKGGVPIDRDTEQAVYRQAQDEARSWPPRVASPAWIRAIEGAEGGRARFIQAALEPAGYTFAEDEAEDLVDRCSLDELGNLMRVCIHGEAIVPKSEAGSTTTTTPEPEIAPSPTSGDQPSSESST